MKAIRYSLCLAALVLSIAPGACTPFNAECATADGNCNFFRALLLSLDSRDTTTYTKYILLVEQGTPGVLHMYRRDRTTGLLTEVSTGALGNSTQKGTTNGTFAYFPNNGTTDISMFAIQNEALVSLGTVSYTAAGNPTVAILHPTNGFLYAATNSGQLEVFRVNADGTLTSHSTFDTMAANSLDSIKFNATGTRAYVVDGGGSFIRYFTIQSDGTLIQQKTVATNLNAPFDAVLDHEKQILYVSNSGATHVALFDVSAGDPVPIGTAGQTNNPFQTHFSPYPERYAYSTSISGNTLTVSTRDLDTGFLSEQNVIGGFSFPVIARPDASGRSLYLTQNTGNALDTYDIDAQTGNVTLNSSITVTTPGDIVRVDATEEN